MDELFDPREGTPRIKIFKASQFKVEGKVQKTTFRHLQDMISVATEKHKFRCIVIGYLKLDYVDGSTRYTIGDIRLCPEPDEEVDWRKKPRIVCIVRERSKSEKFEKLRTAGWSKKRKQEIKRRNTEFTLKNERK